jgi:hypothetical protein
MHESNMKKALLTFLQFLFFLFTFAIGSFLRPFKIQSSLNYPNPDPSIHIAITRFFVWDGLLLMLGLGLAILLIEIARKRLASTTWTTLALIVATAVGLAMKLGFVTQDF